MWIVKVALSRPYTFIVLAILILIAAPVVIVRTPTDIFPNINIPVISIAWQYTGLNPEELEGRLTTPYEKVLTTLVDNIEHTESTTIAGQVIVKVYLQPGAKPRHRECAGLFGVAVHFEKPAAGYPAAADHRVQRLDCTDSSARALGQGIVRTAAERPRPELHPAATGHHSRRCRSQRLRRQATVHHAEPQPEAVAGQGAFAGRCHQCDGGAESSSCPAVQQRSARMSTTSESIPLPSRLRESAICRCARLTGQRVYLHDVATVSDGNIPQTNIVRQDRPPRCSGYGFEVGQRVDVSVVSGIRALLPRIALTVSPDLRMKPIGDQSIFVRASINGVVREAVIAATLTGMMILLFLGSWRSTLIVCLSIPLSILTSLSILSLLGQTINVMTLGGLALAVGILVDDATVAIENTDRNLAMRQTDRPRRPRRGAQNRRADLRVDAVRSVSCSSRCFS